MINVHIIDNSDQIKTTLFADTINISLDIDEVQALNALEKNHASIVLLNYSVCKEETDDYIRLILKNSPNSKVVVIAENLSENQILNCLIAGARGYQDIKQFEHFKQKLIQVIDAGEAWITRCMLAVLQRYSLSQEKRV